MFWRRRTAKDDLIDAFVWALRLRPNDFTSDGYRLSDAQVPALQWWIANSDYGFKATMVEDVEGSLFKRDCGTICFTGGQQKRAWKAVKLWREREPTVQALVERIIEANDEAVEP